MCFVCHPFAERRTFLHCTSYRDTRQSDPSRSGSSIAFLSCVFGHFYSLPWRYSDYSAGLGVVQMVPLSHSRWLRLLSLTFIDWCSCCVYSRISYVVHLLGSTHWTPLISPLHYQHHTNHFLFQQAKCSTNWVQLFETLATRLSASLTSQYVYCRHNICIISPTNHISNKLNKNSLENWTCR